MPLQWPEAGPTFVLQPGAVQLGVSIEPQGEPPNLRFVDAAEP